MKIFYIKRIGSTGFESYYGFTVIADSENEARQICAKHDKQDKETWGSSEKSIAQNIGKASKGQEKGVVMESYRHA
jgi:hypothetical protein